ncbi:MAG: hypothetical protein MH219_18135 [Marinobacter sp.]|nr:hypothetical protein [Marinobacter sp.]
MGLAGGLGIAPVTSVAAVISLMTMANCSVALPGRLHHVYWPSVRVAALAIVPSITAGVLLLNYLSSSASVIVRVLLGLVIIYAAAGPPLIYHYYRQPLEPIRIRNTLTLLFAGHW